MLVLAAGLLALVLAVSATGAPIARTTSLISGPTGVADPNSALTEFEGASADGSRVFFETTQKLTVDDNDSNRVDLYERSGGTTKLVSGPTGVADPDSGVALLSGASDDGSRVFFSTGQKMTADDGDGSGQDVYERSGGTTKLVSGPTGIADPNTGVATFRGASADGSRVFFEHNGKLTADDTDTDRTDVYERAGGATALVSKPTGIADPDSASAFFEGASADGSRVFFLTDQKLTADDGDSNLQDVYERAGGVTALVSKPTGVADPNSAVAEFEGASADGSRVFFETAQKLTADDGDSNLQDVYERAGGVTALVSKPTGVADPNSALVFFSGASDDGSRVFFLTNQKLTADDGDTNRGDVYERAGGATALVSGPTGVADPDTDHVSIQGVSADGSRVFFETVQKLTADDGDTNLIDVYMAADTAAPQTTITGGPSGTTGDSTPSFSFSSSEAGSSFECSVDGGSFTSCASSTTVAPLSEGAHTFQVRARDNAGNLDPTPAARSFTVDAIPLAADTSAPKGRLSGKTTQKLGTSVAVTAACLDEACTALATATTNVPTKLAKSFKLRRARKAIAKGGKAKLKLKLSRKTRTAARRALRKRRKVRVKIKVTLTDAAGNARVLRRTVKLKR